LESPAHRDKLNSFAEFQKYNNEDDIVPGETLILPKYLVPATMAHSFIETHYSGLLKKRYKSKPIISGVEKYLVDTFHILLRLMDNVYLTPYATAVLMFNS